MRYRICSSLIIGLVIILSVNRVSIAAPSNESPWALFLVPILSATNITPDPDPPAPTCAEHKITLCNYWAENETGFEEIARVFLPDCTVKFYEFGRYYYTGTWVPISDTKILAHSRHFSVNGTYISPNRYNETSWSFSCGTKY